MTNSDNWRKALAKEAQKKAAAEKATPVKLATVTPITAAPSYIGRQFNKKGK